MSGKYMPKAKLTWRQPELKQSDEYPVVQVNWNDAVAFCEWLSRKSGASCRLPTEAEWEYACRAGTTTLWHCGNSDATLQEYAWFAANASRKIHPVAQVKPNAWGLFDMHGNVWEWCGDWHDDSYYQNSPPADPLGPMITSSYRVIRGGSWIVPASSCRSAYRLGNQSVNRSSGLGFRVATVPPGK